MPHPRSVELSDLAWAGDADGVLSIVTVEEIAQEWCDLTVSRVARPQSDDDGETGEEWWPAWFLFNCLHRVPQLHRDLLLQLVANAPNDDVLSAIGAGPFEDWVYSNPDGIHWLEVQAAKDSRFQQALDNMRH